MWEDGDFIGVVLFSMGASPWLHNRFGIGKFEVCELSRIALRDHRTPVSRIVRIALKMLRRLCPKLRLVVSFADPPAGHHGGVYQACGWTYCGTSDAATYYIDRRGKVWHARNIGTSECRGNDGWRTRKHSAAGMRKEKRPGKHRYVWAIDPTLRTQVDAMALSYPKSCVTSDTGDTSADSTSKRAVRSRP